MNSGAPAPPENGDAIVHARLEVAGVELMGVRLAETVFESRFAQLRDRFGTLWTIICQRPE